MPNDGKALEALVAYIEETLVPAGFDVTKNERVFEDGVPIAEFDVQVRGRVGSTDIAWLIECRDRPSDGAAPRKWIEQLVGRRIGFGFNKVTAVSTTGFAAGAIDFAAQQHIELRSVSELSPDAFADWLRIDSIDHCTREAVLHHATLLVDEDTTQDCRDALMARLAELDGQVSCLRTSCGRAATLPEAFCGALSTCEQFSADRVSQPNTTIELRAKYAPDDRYSVQTDMGQIDIAAILFRGELRLVHRTAPLLYTGEYRHGESGDIISQVAKFAPMSGAGMRFAMEMHKLGHSGETNIILRVLDTDAEE